MLVKGVVGVFSVEPRARVPLIVARNVWFLDGSRREGNKNLETRRMV